MELLFEIERYEYFQILDRVWKKKKKGGNLNKEAAVPYSVPVSGLKSQQQNPRILDMGIH